MGATAESVEAQAEVGGLLGGGWVGSHTQHPTEARRTIAAQGLHPQETGLGPPGRKRQVLICVSSTEKEKICNCFLTNKP